jgi:2-hydroxychromene-2-carboxylate isomerase
MSAAPVRFLFDFISPYAFLAWTQVRRIVAAHGRTVTPVPVLFAGLLDAHGTKGPAEVPAKRRYLFKDVARKAHRLGIGAVAPPPAHPFNPLLALRIASLPEAILPPPDRDAVIDALFAAAWTKRQAIDTPAAVSSVLRDAGRDPGPLIEAAGAPEVKGRLRGATDAAIAEGVFGVPTAIADGELFWGTESLADLDLFLGGKLPPFSDAAWGDLPATATRRGAGSSS